MTLGHEPRVRYTDAVEQPDEDDGTSRRRPAYFGGVASRPRFGGRRCCSFSGCWADKVMKTKMHFRLLTTLLPWLVLLGCAANGNHSAAGDPRPWDGEVRVHGALRAMFHEGQTGAMVALAALLPNPDVYAVGALADLSGEVTVVGGKAYLW